MLNFWNTFLKPITPQLNNCTETKFQFTTIMIRRRRGDVMIIDFDQFRQLGRWESNRVCVHFIKSR